MGATTTDENGEDVLQYGKRYCSVFASVILSETGSEICIPIFNFIHTGAQDVNLKMLM